MKDSSTCPVCGAPLAQGICPACLLRAALGGNSAIPPDPDETRAAQAATMAHPLTEQPGSRIGHYKLLEQIGEGGFGVVWMAEQEEPLRRRVALKIIKLGMDTREIVTRFEAERQALAMMEHPNIASVFDGGATDTGRPYFVMELVKGVPVTTYCDANKLTTRERLELFLQVCHAVQHAHQKGVIHRDIKPSNILVTVQDDHAVPKIIDFGIAKATQATLTEKTLFTRLNQWIGTPEYMSPEQAGLGSLDVDTRSDIYSLGVLLYELLTGRPPFDSEKLRAAGHDAVMKLIREEEPPKPSTRLSTLAGEELDAVATKRGAEPAKLNRSVRGDLDWIVMKALEKDRRRRYETANGLADDLRRHLDNEVVLARPPGTAYRMKRFIARNRLVAGFSSALLLTLLAGTVISSWQAWRAWQSSREADGQRKIAKEEAASALRFADESVRAKDQSEANAYANRILLASQFWQNGDVENAEKSLDECAPPLRGWEWNYLKRKVHSGLLTIPALHPDSDTLAYPAFGPGDHHICFTQSDTRLWVSAFPDNDLCSSHWVSKEGALYHTTDGTPFRIQPDWLPGVPTTDGLRILSKAKPDSPAAIIDIASGRVLVTLQAGPETPLALSPDERFIASWAKQVTTSAELNNELLISSSADGKVLLRIPMHGGGHELMWSPDSRWLIAGGWTGSGFPCWVVEAETGRIVLSLEFSLGGGNAAFASKSGKLVIVADPHMTESGDCTLSAWNLQTGLRLFERVIHSGPGQILNPVVSFAENDSTIVVARVGSNAGPTEGDSSGQDDLLLFGADSGELKRGLRLDSGLGKGPRILVVGHAKGGVEIGPLYGIRTMSVSPDGQRLAAGTLDGCVHVIEVARPEIHQILRGHRASIAGLAFDTKGSRLATLDHFGEVKLWDASPPATPSLKELYEGELIALSANGRCVAWSEENCTRIADLDRHRCLALPDRGFHRPGSLSPDGRWFDGERGVWDTDQGLLVPQLLGGEQDHQILGFSGNGRRVALRAKALESNKELLQVQVVDVATWAPVAIFSMADLDFQLNEDGTLAAFMGTNGLVQIHKLANGTNATRPIAEFAGKAPFQFAPDASWLLTGRADGGFQQIAVQSGIVQGAFPSRTKDALGFEISRSGRYARVRSRGHQDLRGWPERPGEIWDLTTGETLGEVPFRVHPDSTVFHPDSTRVALQEPDSLLRIWNMDQRKVLMTLPVQALAWAWSQDGNRLMVVRTDLEIEEFDGSPWKPGERNAPGVPFEDLTVARATSVPGVELVAWLGHQKIREDQGSAAQARPGTIFRIDRDGSMELYQLPAAPSADRAAFVDSYGYSNPMGSVVNRSDIVKPGDYVFTAPGGNEVFRPNDRLGLAQRVANHNPKNGRWDWWDGLVVAGNLACFLGNSRGPRFETQIFDISMPESPVQRGTFSSPFRGNCGHLAGKKLFLGIHHDNYEENSDKQSHHPINLLEAVDLSDPIHPVSIGQLALPDYPDELLAAGPGRLIALLYESVVLIDISDPTKMKMIGTPLSAPAHTGVIMPWGQRRLLITGAAAISVAEDGLKLEGWLPGNGWEDATSVDDLAIIQNSPGAYVFRVSPPP